MNQSISTAWPVVLSVAGFDPSAGAGIVALLVAVVAVSQILTVIPAGHVGVVDFFGTGSPVTLKAGINFVNPLARVFKFSVKTQEIKETMDVPSKEGLTVQLEISTLFHLDPDKAAEVYKTIGPNYIEIILEPQFRSVARGVTAGYEAKALYTSEREMLAEIIQKDLQKLKGTGDFFTVPAGTFAIFWPHDGHMPDVALKSPQPVKKAVVKVLVG
jgi:regulator of protease activity HflC (stomatin/prohibitin superfamily)